MFVFRVTHVWEGKKAGDLDDKYYKSIRGKQKYFFRVENGKIYLFDEKLKFLDYGEKTKEPFILKNEERDKKKMADFRINYSNGGRFTIYEDLIGKLTQYNDVSSVLFSLEGQVNYVSEKKYNVPNFENIVESCQ